MWWSSSSAAEPRLSPNRRFALAPPRAGLAALAVVLVVVPGSINLAVTLLLLVGGMALLLPPRGPGRPVSSRRTHPVRPPGAS